MDHWEKEEPCWPCRRAGFENQGSIGSDRELPACLLGIVFAGAKRARNDDAAVEA
jgi:hypothetical protein